MRSALSCALGGEPSGAGDMAERRRRTVVFQDSDALQTLCGQRDDNLHWIEQRLAVQILPRGSELHVYGDGDEVDLASEVLSAAYVHALAGQDVDLPVLQQAMTRYGPKRVVGGEVARLEVAPRGGTVRNLAAARSRVLARSEEAPESLDGARLVQPRTAGQAAYFEAIRDHDLTFGVGPAGSGKTWLAVASAMGALQRREVKRLILTRPAVEAGEHLGFLPGDLREKVSPYLRPLYDALGDMLDADKLERMLERGQIEAAPLAFMRGRTLANAFVVLDEAQNCTVEQMLMLLTRMGEHTKMVVTGDPTQSDLKYGQRSGLDHALRVLQGVPGIAIQRLGREDIVRHPLVGRIVDAYEADRARAAAEGQR